VRSFSYWWVTFPLIIAAAFIMCWSYQVASHSQNVFDALLGLGTSLFLAIPLVAFVALLTLHLDGNKEIEMIDIMIPTFISEGVFLLVLCGLLSTDKRRRYLYTFASFCVVIPLIVFQVLLLLRVSEGWNFAVTFAPCFIGEVALIFCGCTWAARELRMLPEDVMECLDPEDPDRP